MCEKHGLTVENILYYSGNKQFLLLVRCTKDSDMNFKEAIEETIALFNAFTKKGESKI